MISKATEPWAERYAKTHNADGTPNSKHPRTSPKADLDALREAGQADRARIDLVLAMATPDEIWRSMGRVGLQKAIEAEPDRVELVEYLDALPELAKPVAQSPAVPGRGEPTEPASVTPINRTRPRQRRLDRPRVIYPRLEF
jgi:hypothetical protein